MKTFKKAYLPKSIKYSGEIYTMNATISWAMSESGTRPEKVLEALKSTGKKGVLVLVLSNNLKGRTDIHGHEYQPTKWIFTN